MANNNKSKLHVVNTQIADMWDRELDGDEDIKKWEEKHHRNRV